jgi:hypothetical protein
VRQGEGHGNANGNSEMNEIWNGEPTVIGKGILTVTS